MFAQIQDLLAQRQRQINVEFEGHDAGHALHAEQANDLVRQINASGTHVYHRVDGLISRGEFDTAREKFNGVIKSGESRQRAENESGMAYTTLVHCKRLFEAAGR